MKNPVSTTPHHLRIEALHGGHDRRNFSCGKAALDDYLRRYARQHASTNVSRSYVAVAGESTAIRGYYSLTMAAIHRAHLPDRYTKKFPNFPLPVARLARLARLAVDQRHQRQRIGELLLADALQRCLSLSLSIGMIGVIVDAKDQQAKQWYARYEFEHLPDSPLTLWLPTSAIERL